MGAASEKQRQVVMVIILLAFAAVFFRLVQTVRAVNEPDPSSVNRSAIERSLSIDKIRFRVDEVLYVNQDFSAYMFMGKGEAFSSFEISPERDELLSEKEFRSAYPSRYGEIRRFTRGGQTLWGIVLSTTAGEWEQGRERYLENWRLAKERFKSRAKDHE